MQLIMSTQSTKNTIEAPEPSVQSLVGAGLQQSVTSFDPTSWVSGLSGLQALARQAAGVENES